MAVADVNTYLDFATVALALGALLAALKTIRDARDARREATDAHREAMLEQKKLLTSTTAAYETETAQRVTEALSNEALQRLIRLGNIGQLLSELALAAGKEAKEHGEYDPDPKEPNPTLRHPASPVSALLRRFEAELGIYEALGGEPQADLQAWADRAQWPTLPNSTIKNATEHRFQDLALLIRHEGERLSELSAIMDGLYRGITADQETDSSAS